MLVYPVVAVWLVLLLATLSRAQCPNNTIVFQGSYTNGYTSWNASWVTDCNNGHFVITITCNSPGWVGFGLNSVGGMVGGDMMQLYVNATGAVHYQNGHATKYGQPSAVPRSIYSLVTGRSNGTLYTFSFLRYLSSNDSSGRTIDQTPWLLWSFSQSGSFDVWHGSNCGFDQVNFFTGGSTIGGGGTVVNYRLIHGLLMLFALGFLALIATFAARYLKNIGHMWYTLHSWIQYTVLTSVLASFVLIEYSIGPGLNEHFSSLHSIVGVILVGLLIVQVIFGIVANAMFKAERKKVPVFPDIVHWWLGRSLIAGAITNIFLGLDLYGFRQSGQLAPYIVFAVWVGLTFLVTAVMEFKQGQINHLAVNYTPIDGATTQLGVRVYVGYITAGAILYATCFYFIYHHRKL